MSNRLISLILSAAYLSTGHSSNTTAQAAKRAEPAAQIKNPTWVGPSAYRQPQVLFTHNLKTSEARAYLPVTLPACRQARRIRVRLTSLYRFEPDLRSPTAGRWLPVETKSKPIDLFCNQSLPIVELTGGVELRLGTYWAVLEVNGQPDFSFVYVGKMACNDVSLAGPKPPGTIALCVLHPTHAAAQFVPEPPEWRRVSLE